MIHQTVASFVCIRFYSFIMRLPVVYTRLPVVCTRLHSSNVLESTTSQTCLVKFPFGLDILDDPHYLRGRALKITILHTRKLADFTMHHYARQNRPRYL